MNLSEADLKRCFRHDQFAAHSNIELLTAGPGHATAKMTLQAHHLNGLNFFFELSFFARIAD